MRRMRNCSKVSLLRALYFFITSTVLLLYLLLATRLDLRDKSAIDGGVVKSLTLKHRISEELGDVDWKVKSEGVGKALSQSSQEDSFFNPSTPFQKVIPEEENCAPQNTRLYPFCADKFLYVKYMWRTKCFKTVHGVDGTDCSILKYLREHEPFCWHKSSYIVKQLQRHENTNVVFKKSLDGILDLLSDPLYRWLRMRVTQMWPSWVETVNELDQNMKIKNRKKRKIIFYLASMGHDTRFFLYAGRGGPVGELVQWTDTIASAYLLGHDIEVFYNISDVKTYLKGSQDGCPPKDSLTDLSDHDIILTDLNGFYSLRYVLGGSVIAHYRCKLRFLDSFGTEPEFNLGSYSLPIPGGRSKWGTAELPLQQMMTMYPHTPDNTFLGFVAGSIIKEKIPKKKNQAVIYGKLASYFKNQSSYLDVANEFFDLHATSTGGHEIPDYVTNHGVLDSKSLKKLLLESKVFLGLGFPYEGPGPLDAIAAGAVYINPKFDPPRNRLNEDFFKGKPTLRKVTSQNPYMEDFIKEPYTYTVHISDHNKLRQIFKKIKEQDDLPSYLPREYTTTGMVERLHALFEHQNFCDEDAAPWPPLSSQKLYIAKEGVSCKTLCRDKGLICEPSYFHALNNVESLTRYGYDCSQTVESQLLYAPSYNTVNHTCHIQSHTLLYSCAAESPAHERLCPCRDFIKDQTALCKDCL